jgi:hypothetical protein
MTQPGHSRSRAASVLPHLVFVGIIMMILLGWQATCGRRVRGRPADGGDSGGSVRISVGGVLSFIFAVLIVLPIIDIYRRYYTGRIAFFLTWTTFVATAVAGLVVELLFNAIGWVPSPRHATMTEAQITWNYTTVLNVVFLAVAGLRWRAALTGGFKMLGMMNAAPSDQHAGRQRVRHVH